MDRERIFNNLIQKTAKNSEEYIKTLVDKIREIIYISDIQSYAFIDGVDIEMTEDEITEFRMDYIDINGNYQQDYMLILKLVTALNIILY